MSNGKTRSEVLRVALILGNQPIEETIVTDDDLTIGQSTKNTFAVPLAVLPSMWKLIDKQGDKYFLRVTSKMDGRIATKSNRKMLTELLPSAQRDGDAYVIPLESKSWGKIEVGAAKILFQFIKEPPVIPRPTLPAAVTGGLLAGLSTTLLVCCASTISLFSILVALAYFHEVPVQRDFVTEVAKEYLEPEKAVVINVPDEPVVADTKPADDGEKVVKKKPKSGGEKKDPVAKASKPTGGAGGGSKVEREAKADAEIATFLEGLSAEGSSGSGPAMSDRSPGGDINSQAKTVRDRGDSASIGGGTSRVRGSGDGAVGTGKGPDLGGTGTGPKSSGVKVKEKVPKGRVKVGRASADDDTTLTPGSVAGKINAKYKNGLRRCYEKELKGNGRASGRVKISFTVNESGRTTRPKASGVSPSLATCIKSRMKTWKFPVPKDEDGDKTDASFALTLALAPG